MSFTANSSLTLLASIILGHDADPSANSAPIQVHIPSCSLAEDAEGKFTLFHIHCKLGVFSWEVRKRYTQFKNLQSAMDSSRASASVVLPALPKKKIIGSNLAESFVEERRVGLEFYLQQLVVIPALLSMPAFIEFLEDKSMTHRHLFDIQTEMSRMKSSLEFVQSENRSLRDELKIAKEDIKRAHFFIRDMTARVATLEDGKRDGDFPNMSSARNSSFTLGTSHESARSHSSVNLHASQEVSQVDNVNTWPTITQSLGQPNLSRLGDGNLPGHEASSQVPGMGVQLSPSFSDLNSVGGNVEDRSMRRTPSLVNRASNASIEHFADPLALQPGRETPSYGNLIELDSSAGYFVSQMVTLGNRNFAISGNVTTDVYAGDDIGPRCGSNFTQRDGDALWSKVVGMMQNENDVNVLPQRRHSNKFLTIIQPEMLAITAEASLWDNLVDEIVSMVQPTEQQMNYRRSISRFLSRQCNKILGAKGFDIGLQGLRCFLPDDPVQISIFLSRGQDVLWHVRLNERLCRLSGGGGSLHAMEDDCLDTMPDLSHSLSNVIFIKTADETGHRLLCIADTVVGGEILMNARFELCLIAFWEDFSRAIGKNNLFKRSLLLIRAWWVYEAKMHYFASGIPDSALIVMIMSIFNRFYDRMHHPLHVFCQFLSEYSTLDLSAFVITINGPVSIDFFISTPENHIVQQSGTFLSHEFLCRYQNLALAKEVEENSISSLMNETSDAHVMATSAEKSRAFGGRPMMVAHPLISGKNMIPDQKEARSNSLFVTEAFRAGATAVLAMLSPEAGADSSSNAHLVVETMFKTVIQRFGRGWKPDAPLTFNAMITRENFLSLEGGTFSLSSPLVSAEDASTEAAELGLSADPMLISLDKLWERILYCNLILESRVSESALHTLSCQVLKEKGPLPVGEVGKMLQEACPAIPNMSLILKERFNGLKKFLERYMEDFVLGQDHPFNPTVYLKCMLSIEDMAAIKRGDSVQLAAFGKSSSKKNTHQRGGGAPGSAGKGNAGMKKKAYPHSLSMHAIGAYSSSTAMDSRQQQHNGTARMQRNSVDGGISRGLTSGPTMFRNSISGPVMGHKDSHLHMESIPFLNQMKGVQYLSTTRNSFDMQGMQPSYMRSLHGGMDIFGSDAYFGSSGGQAGGTIPSAALGNSNHLPDHSVLARAFVPRSHSARSLNTDGGDQRF